jgi:porin
MWAILPRCCACLNRAANVYGGEFYYDAEIKPWFHLSFDLQAVQPGFKSRDVAIIPALRGKIDFLICYILGTA